MKRVLEAFFYNTPPHYKSFTKHIMPSVFFVVNIVTLARKVCKRTKWTRLNKLPIAKAHEMRYNSNMDTKELYREILNEHNLNPLHKKELPGATCVLDGVNPSCGDKITLNLKVEDGKISDASYTGSGCAISQASCDMMIDLILGKSEDEAKRLCDVFMRMITGTVTDEELESLDEAAALQDIAKMPARVKCAELGWRTMKEALGAKA